MRRFPCLILLIFALSSGLPAAEPLSRDALVRIALRENRTVKAVRARWAALGERIPQERAWEDLMAGVDLQRAGSTQFFKATDAEYMLSQTLPVSGKNRSRERAALAETRSAFQELRRAELDLISRVQGAYFRLSGGYGQLVINQRNQELLKQFADLSRKKYEVGTATQSDVLLAETELARLSETTATIQRDISDQQTRLNVLMNRRAGSPLSEPEPLRFDPPRLGADEATTIALARRPEVLMALRKIEANKARVQLSHRQWFPDPQIQIKAREFAGKAGIQEYDTGIFFSVPWVNHAKYAAGEAEAAANLADTENQYAAARTEVTGLVRDQFKKIETFAANYRLFQDKVLPTAELAVKTTRAGYETDKNSFLELVTARRSSQDIESSALNQLIEHQVAVAELDSVVGVSHFRPDESPKTTTHTHRIDPMKANTLNSLSMLALGALTWIATASASFAADLSPADKQFLAGDEKISAALVADDLSSAKKAATVLGEVGSDLAKSHSLEEARTAFSKLCDTAKKLTEGKPGYYVVHCSMVNKDWVQTSKKVANPYGGKAMAECGEVKTK